MKGEIPPPPRLALSKAEAAAALSVSVDHFERHILAELKVVYCGARRLYPVRELERWLAERAAPVLPVTRTNSADEVPAKQRVRASRGPVSQSRDRGAA